MNDLIYSEEDEIRLQRIQQQKEMLIEAFNIKYQYAETHQANN
jgi:hypothetical protein